MEKSSSAVHEVLLITRAGRSSLWILSGDTLEVDSGEKVKGVDLGDSKDGKKDRNAGSLSKGKEA